MIGGNDDKRLVVDPGGTQSREQPPHKRVGVLELEQMTLLRLAREELVVERLVAVESRLRVGAALVDLAGREEAEWLVREQHVHEPQRRPRVAGRCPDLSEGSREPLLTPAVQEIEQARALLLADAARAELRALLVRPDPVALAQQREQVDRVVG